MTRSLAALLALALVACSGDDDGLDAASSADAASSGPDAAPPPSPAIDVLFVIDDSMSMAEEQALLAANVRSLLSPIEIGLGGPADLHLGVVSSDLGIGGYSCPGCSGDGDGGDLQSAARLPGCAVPDGAFISDVAGPDGGRVRNYTGTLADTFACIARLGTDGCGFEQPLEAMMAALDGLNPGNAGFLRDDAFLAVIILSDEDDCSAQAADVFDPAQASLSDPLGPFSSFRCAEFGVLCCNGPACTPGPISRSPADYDTCVSRGDSYLRDPSFYAAFLASRKLDDRYFVGVISGPPRPFGVERSDEGEPWLKPACQTAAGGRAYPSVRLASLVEAVPHGRMETICADDLAPQLTALGEAIAAAMR
jgi:hypothetical protein